MLKTLIQKLDRFAELSKLEKRLLSEAVCDTREYRPRENIVCEGDQPDAVHVLVDGWAGRYRVLPGGERMVVACLIPGDLCGGQISPLLRMDHSVTALSRCKAALIPRGALSALLCESEQLSQALYAAGLVDEAIAREWLMGTACRPADQRVAHFICEMLLRARAAGLTDDSGFTLPLTIEELAGTMGLTALHVGRLFQELRAKGLIVTRGKRLTVTGLDRLMECSGYSPLYLHQLAGDVLRPLEPRYREA